MDFNESQFVQRSVIYEVNGVRYDRLEDVPAEFRTFFEDLDGNGSPDLVEWQSKKNKTVMRFESRTTSGSRARDARALRHLLDSNQSTNQPVDGSIRCSACGYDLRTASLDGRCPECGQSVTRSIQQLIRPRRSIGRLLLELAVDNPRLLSSIILIMIVLGFVGFLILRAIS